MHADAAPRPLLVTFVIVVGLCLLLPLQIAGDSFLVDRNSALLMQSVVVVHSGACLALTLTHPRPQVVQFGFWLFSYVWLGLAPITMLSADTYPWGLRADESASFLSSLLIEVGLVGYSFGAFLASLGRGSNVGAKGWLVDREFALGRVICVGVLSICLAVVLIPRVGGVATFFESREAAKAATTTLVGDTGKAGRALVNWGLCVPAFVALLGFVFVDKRRGTPVQLMLWGLLLAPIIVLNLVVNNPISQPRYWAGTVLLGLVFALPKLNTINRFRACAVVVLIGALVVFPVTDYFRNDNPDRPALVLSEQYVTNADYDAYQQIQGGVMMVEETGHRPSLAAGPLLFWVPRAVWPAKPKDAGTVIGEFLGYRFLNLSSPLWVETYIWGGPPLAGAFLALWGLVGGWLDLQFQRARRGEGRVVFALVPALAFFQLILLRGSLLQAMPALTLLLGFSWLSSRRRPIHRIAEQRPNPGLSMTMTTSSG